MTTVPPTPAKKKNTATSAQSKAAAAESLHRKLKQEFRREIPYEFAADAPGTTRCVCVCVCIERERERERDKKNVCV